MTFIINPFINAGVASLPPPTWTGKNGVTESPTGLLTKTAAGDGWGSCGAVSNETQAGNCRFTFYWENRSSPQFFLGIGPDSSCSTYSGIDWAWNLRNTVIDAQIWENGSNSASGITSGTNGDMLEIERVGTTVKFYHKNYTTPSRPSPGDSGRSLIYTSPNSSTGALYINVAGFLFGCTIDAANMQWGAI